MLLGDIDHEGNAVDDGSANASADEGTKVDEKESNGLIAMAGNLVPFNRVGSNLAKVEEVSLLHDLCPSHCKPSLSMCFCCGGHVLRGLLLTRVVNPKLSITIAIVALFVLPTAYCPPRLVFHQPSFILHYQLSTAQ